MSINKKRGSIALARQLCYEIAGATSGDDDISGSDYGSVDIAEILSAEVERLRETLTQPEQEPTPWRDMIVATLVREGVNKHRARELADYFAAQPEQEPVAFYHPRNGFYWAKPTSIFAPTAVDVPPMPLYAAAERNHG